MTNARLTQAERKSELIQISIQFGDSVAELASQCISAIAAPLVLALVGFGFCPRPRIGNTLNKYPADFGHLFQT